MILSLRKMGFVVALLTAVTMGPFASSTHAEDKVIIIKKPATTTEDAPARAEEPAKLVDDSKEETSAENPGRYAPEFCDFEITFPEKPYRAQKCLPERGCYDLHSYTMVYDLRTTVDVSVTCNPSTPVDFKRYNQAVMKAALQGMVSQRQLDNYDVEYKELKDVHSASLTGTGKTGAQDKIYTAQLWIGKNSVFTMQAELIGSEHDEADKIFSEILKSIKMKETKPLTAKTETKSKE